MSPVRGFSHVGVSTHDMDRTIQFYESVLGFERVVDELTQVSAGGTLRQVYFDLGGGQFIVFMEPRQIPGISPDYCTGINAALGVPLGMYHFALNVPSLESLQAYRTQLTARGIEVSAIIDLGHAQAIFLQDPNGLELEFCCQTRPFNDDDLRRVSEAKLAS
jgi:catechol 2,3-dioxygenase-like lactoylglutathione lyase family enzyme